MKRATSRLLAALLAVALCLTGCGKKTGMNDKNGDDAGNNMPVISITSFKELGDYNLTNAACFDDGIIRLYYDGNYFLPLRMECPNDTFCELTIGQADLRNTDKNFVHGYVYYAPGKFQDSMDHIVECEEEYAFNGLPEDVVKSEYLTPTDNYRGYTYKYSINENTPMYAILIAKNEDDGNGCYVAMIKSDMAEAVEKAKETFGTIEIYGETADEVKINDSFNRTEDLYRILVPSSDSSALFSEKYAVENIEESVNKPSTIHYTEFKHEMHALGEKYIPEMYGEATNDSLSYMSTDETVVTVDQNGEITAVGEGLASIVATTEDGNVASIYIDVILSETQEEVE